jgi:pimeloyl-[acyl-carrier protein] methyl ester esterase
VPAEPIPVLLLPGLEGTGRLFARFVAAATGALDLRAVRYPTDRALGYAALLRLVRKQLPREERWALLGESFSGPLALRLAAEAPPGLRAVALAASFHRQPARRWLSAFRTAAPLFFNAPFPAPAVRALLAGFDAPDDLVTEVRAAVAAVPGRVMVARAEEALEVDASRPLEASRLPLLVLAGRHDRLLRRAIPEEIRALRPDAVIHLLDAPHLVLQRQPARSMALLEDFLRRAA